MQYRELGRTGFRISALGFGAMRLPLTEADGRPVVDEALAIPMLRRAFEAGVNYVDTAYPYGRGTSELAVGKALKGWRDRVMLSTKYPLGRPGARREDFRRILEEQLGKLDVARIDFYHLHGLDRKHWADEVVPLGLLEEMERARAEGLIRFKCFSFHDKPDALRAFADSGAFDSVLCQYNMVDRANEEAMAYARERGLGVIVMGPVGGGRLGTPMEYLRAAVGGGAPTPQLALRFVLSNPDVCCALSGMSTLQQVEDNVRAAAQLGPLSEEELERVREVMATRGELARGYCTGCGYCMPCPHEVNIPTCFECLIHHRVYGFTDAAMRRYRAIGDRWLKGKRADACAGCGECEPKCPQKIPIRRQLAEVARELGSRLAAK